ncbi:MAG: nucleotidyltransferase domain-containing protein [Firmicutes bacterium]|nr:nucleotidyltransferase domain-containing protein [Bacillota bacterium]
MCSQNELNILMTKIAEIYRQVYGENIFKILLYGSYARGTQDAESDVDVVAIVRGNRADLQKKLREVWTLSSDLELEYETVLSPTVIPFDEYEEYREVLPYYRNIDREGVSIVA